ncbi:hypothetical protein K3555_22825 (plasmid) [Leisingera sp. M527]|uniref:hypothetical protein n=1 Tax=Leisingera sp. M527 TaxID=2867014 RepID=UPI0021A6139B|nr:hypothetical protein [Leisingera sp. M527]UWQ35363.1 hypothetical protein K3555_22825 [Leisingera sp. M527]
MISLRFFNLWAVLGLVACTIPASQDFEAYEASYARARDAGKQVVEVYNQYDKVNRARRTDNNTFDPNFADVYVPEALSPLSIKIEAGFASATVFNEVLGRYATNNSLSLQTENVETLNASVGSIAGLVGEPQIANQINAVVEASLALGNLSLAQSDREEFIRLVQAHANTVDTFLAVVRDDTKAMFSDARTATALGNGSFNKLEEFRQMLASWVLLIDQTRSDLAALERAVERGDSGAPILGLLAESTQRIDRYAAEISAVRRKLLGVF